MRYFKITVYLLPLVVEQSRETSLHILGFAGYTQLQMVKIFSASVFIRNSYKERAENTFFEQYSERIWFLAYDRIPTK